MVRYIETQPDCGRVLDLSGHYWHAVLDIDGIIEDIKMLNRI
jgi:hypothetical protein